MSDNLVLGRGKLYFDSFLPGTETKTGERYLGSTAAFTLSGESQKLEHYSSESGLRIKDQSVTLQIDYTGSITAENISKENLGMFFFGSSETATIASASGETEQFTAIPDMYYQLGATAAKPEGVENVSAVSVVIDPGGADTATTVDVDYTVDLDEGFIQIIAGGGISSGDVIEVTYDIAAQTQERIISGSDLITGALRFRARNGVGGQKNFYMPKVTLSPNGEFALKGEEWQNMGFNVEVLKNGNLPNVAISGRGVTS